MGDPFGVKKAAKTQANAVTASAEAQARSDREAARGAQQSAELTIAQDKAAKAAAELLATPTENVDVSLNPNVSDTTALDSSGRRRTKRATFMTPTSSGVNL